MSLYDTTQVYWLLHQWKRRAEKDYGEDSLRAHMIDVVIHEIQGKLSALYYRQHNG